MDLTSSYWAWISVNLLPALGFILAVLVLAHILMTRRSPPSTLAWLMAIIFVPVLGVTLYLLFGGRKTQHMIESKPLLPEPEQTIDSGELAPGAYIQNKRHGVFRPYAKNSTVLLSDGVHAFHETIRLIEEAQESVYLATFIMGKDRTGSWLIEALAAKASQGVRVRLLMDALGSMKINRRFTRHLTAAGGKVDFFMPMMRLPFRGRANLRNHRKILTVDGRSAIVGGMNLAHEYMGPKMAPGRWLDMAMMVEGPVVANLETVFRSDWKFASGETLPESVIPPWENSDRRQATLQVIASGPDVKGDSLRDSLLTWIFKAETRAWIVTPYFVPDELLVQALSIAARRGVDVRIIIPRRSNHLMADLARAAYLTYLQEAGVSVMLYQPGMLHAKAIIVDDTVAVVGSANMDMRSLLLNYEVALAIYTPAVIREVDAWMGWLLSHCLPRQTKASPFKELAYGLGRIFAPLL
ncbi:cardiolipin synthase [Desulfatibacillum alkenivorans DSM 16219]|jgi:cardiolipin synthase|uniref:Cardiolipin synthase n=1 Tax=Desulfatibacillum alkenivorans DSM 16219 TaxID=1121393 RepID=A0A1M6ZUK0_9BACT|nr:phospholipase D-like domain-containing protein [Desulfatibacillum alkenivorans]SHL34086.1 cardiolipin synthase [Desulfatibacillum alkenivorans DSM 16219]